MIRYRHCSPAAAVVAAFVLSSCDTTPEIENPPQQDNFHQALIIMLQCRNRFDVALTTLSQSAQYLSAGERLEVLSRATSARVRCEGGIDPYLTAEGIRVPR